jgi:hypothetical protein
MSLQTVPMTFRQAAAFVAKYHRHNKAPRGCKFALGAVDADGVLHGVAMAGRPIARSWDDGFTIEVNRTCTDGTKNANSFLYAACWRVAREMGYRRAITYTQGNETGVSLKAAGWKIIGERKARGSWRTETTDELLRQMRDPIGNGGVPRVIWEIAHAGT